MAEQSFIFDFIRTPDFMDNFNRSGCFDVNDMDGINKNYEFVLSSSCPDNIEDCLDSEGCLKNTVTTVNVGDDGQISLLWSKGIGNDRTISLGGNSSVTLDVGDVNVMMKGLFLRDISTGYVLAYCILTRTVPITNEVVFPASGLLWNIRNIE